MVKPIVALVGRPNVGKSTLFNRLIGRRTAIVDDMPGVTRDRLYGDVEWDGKEFTLIDTGGLFLDDPDFSEHVEEQVRTAISEAVLVVFVVDARVGPTVEDDRIAQELLKSKRKTIVAVNKVDDFRDAYTYEFYNLGLGDPVPISSLHGLNIDELLDRIVELLPENEIRMKDETGEVRVALVGRPNVGKSTLSNALLQEERMIVSDVAGTTRDAIDICLERDGRRYILVDTAGIRKRSRVEKGVEYYGVKRALRSIDRADVVLLIIDAETGIVEQDKKIAGYIEESGKGVIIVINKWDSAMKIIDNRRDFEVYVRTQLDFISYAPLRFVSALTGEGVDHILKDVDAVCSEQNKRLTTSNLNSWLNEVVYLNPPSGVGKQGVKFYYATQVGTKPPVIACFVNNPNMVHFSYKRYLERQLRQAYGFEGTPVRLVFRARRRSSSK
jgi:GTP-binding protein